jgi:uncharacterized protein (TIGR03118 family)
MYHSTISGAAQAVIISASILGTAVAGVAAGFLETDLVANKTPLIDANGVKHTPVLKPDTNLVNPWGVGSTPTSQIWVSDNGTGLSTTYITPVTPPPPPTIKLGTRVVTIPPFDPKKPPGTPTGLVFNPVAGAFQIGTVPASASFLFATEDGTIQGWSSSVDPSNAVIAVPNKNVMSSGAVYKGLAIATDATATPTSTTRLYATNFHAGTVEVFSTTFMPVAPPGAFTDPHLPKGYAPFNIVNIGDKLFVTYAVQDANRHDDVAGMSHGIVNVFDLKGNLLQRLIQHGQLNSPWGVALAPATFGALANKLLIGNFGNGHINAYDPTTGEFIDKVRDANGQAIVIDGLWSLHVGNNNGTNNGGGGLTTNVYFTAGPNGEQDGLFGYLAPN